MRWSPTCTKAGKRRTNHVVERVISEFNAQEQHLKEYTEKGTATRIHQGESQGSASLTAKLLNKLAFELLQVQHTFFLDAWAPLPLPPPVRFACQKRATQVARCMVSDTHFNELHAW
eukprot:TRINITY_DN2817_c0_g1_i1.p3 TRINITY_DN2817_c0_g1~~TRINITY_DN2817_c0_g1_i1.p3  ORF type:complete len:117 (+),score=3.08 TRINITY_DN2817_c0_g1_i1:155-505(+)